MPWWPVWNLWDCMSRTVSSSLWRVKSDYEACGQSGTSGTAYRGQMAPPCGMWIACLPRLMPWLFPVSCIKHVSQAWCHGHHGASLELRCEDGWLQQFPRVPRGGDEGRTVDKGEERWARQGCLLSLFGCLPFLSYLSLLWCLEKRREWAGLGCPIVFHCLMVMSYPVFGVQKWERERGSKEKRKKEEWTV